MFAGRSLLNAERGGFEPPVPFPVHSISSAAQSATLSPLRNHCLLRHRNPFPTAISQPTPDAVHFPCSMINKHWRNHTPFFVNIPVGLDSRTGNFRGMLCLVLSQSSTNECSRSRETSVRTSTSSATPQNMADRAQFFSSFPVSCVQTIRTCDRPTSPPGCQYRSGNIHPRSENRRR